MERVQRNQNNRDSLISYVTQSYQNVNAYLKEGKRTDVSALIIAGAWVETLYLSTQYAGKKGEKAMRQRVAEQTYSLNQLVNYLNLFATSNRVNQMKEDLIKLQMIYKDVIVIGGETSVEKDKNGTTTIGSTDTITMSDATLAKIAAEVVVIRNKYIL
jgi:DNA-directed RNA polymerase subunit F